MKKVAFAFLSILLIFGIAIAQSEKININIANEKTLSSLPGVGIKTAKKIVDYRTAHGFFNNIEEIKNVSGIGEKKFQKLKEMITIQGGIAQIKKNTRKKF